MIIGDYLHAYLIKKYQGAISLDRDSLKLMCHRNRYSPGALLYGKYLKWENQPKVMYRS